MRGLIALPLFFAAPAFGQDLPPERELSSRTKVEHASSTATDGDAPAPVTTTISAETLSAQRWAGAQWFGYGLVPIVIVPAAFFGLSPSCGARGRELGCLVGTVLAFGLGTTIGVSTGVLGGASAVRKKGQSHGVYGGKWRARGGALLGGAAGFVSGGSIGWVGTGLAVCGTLGNCYRSEALQSIDGEALQSIGGLVGAVIGGAIGAGYGATWANNTVRRAPAAKQTSRPIVPSVLHGSR